MPSTIAIYGIKNCDTVKKALTWLKQQSLEFEFHDFKKEVLTADLVEQWFSQVGEANLINRRGTTWRKLHDAQKSLTSQAKLVQLIIENPSLVKRPVLFFNDSYSVGFNEDNWKQQLL